MRPAVSPTGWQSERARFGGWEVLVTVRDGHVLCALSTGPAASGHVEDTAALQLADLIGTAAAELSGGATWRVGLSRPHAGPPGIFGCCIEALEAVDVADRLELSEPVVRARTVLVYRVLLRDETAMSELVERAMTSRLRRVAGLTGYAAADPTHQLRLHVAVQGARLLDWPHRALVRE